jgi:hypothetical protein
VKSVTEGIDAIGEVTIRLRRDGSLYSGHAADTDVVVAAAMAFVNALNRLVAGQERQSVASAKGSSRAGRQADSLTHQPMRRLPPQGCAVDTAHPFWLCWC